MSRPLRLAAIPLFAGVPEAALARYEGACAPVSHPAGRWVLAQGEEGTDVYALTSGSARAMTFGADREVILADLRPGAVFGEMSSFDGGARSASVIAVSDVELLKMPATVFRTAMHENPVVCDRVLALLVGRIRALDTRVHEFANYTVRDRVRAELLRLSRPVSGGRAEALVDPCTHAEIAARIGTHREAVTRELRAIEKAGLLAKRNGRLILTDMPRLAESIGDGE
jgi:CRP/FNR family cyclic AMP-dependent transcriptional regulator